MKHKVVHIVSGNVRNGNWDMVATAHDADGDSWRYSDQRLAARSAEYKRKQKTNQRLKDEKYQRDSLAAFMEALAKLNKKKKS